MLAAVRGWMVVVMALALGPFSGCYLHHGLEPEGPCDGAPIDETPMRSFVRPTDDEIAFELVGEPTILADVTATSTLVLGADGLGLFTSSPASYTPLDSTAVPSGPTVAFEVDDGGYATASYLDSTYAVTTRGFRTAPSLTFFDASGRRITTAETMASGTFHVATAGSACFAAAARAEDDEDDRRPARLTFWGTDGVRVAEPHTLTETAINDPVTVTVGHRTVALWHETRPMRVGRVLFAQTFEGARPVTAPTEIDGNLFGGVLSAVAVGDRIAVIGVDESIDYHLRLDVIDPAALRRASGGEIEASARARDGALVAMTTIPGVEAVVLCTNNRGQLYISIVGLDGVQWGQALVVPDAYVTSCQWTGSEVVGVGSWPAETPGRGHFVTFRVRPTFL